MTDEKNKVELSGFSNPENNGVFDKLEDIRWVEASPEAIAAANEALTEMKHRSFTARNAYLGKMINCQVCRRRHRRVDVAIYKNGQTEVLITKCEQKFKELWVEEDPETGELTLVKATVPLPDQKPTIKAIVGAAAVAKKRKQPRPNPAANWLVQLTRRIFAGINPERFPEEAARMLEAKRIGINTIRNARERVAKRIRQEQKESRRINRAH